REGRAGPHDEQDEQERLHEDEDELVEERVVSPPVLRAEGELPTAEEHQRRQDAHAPHGRVLAQGEDDRPPDARVLTPGTAYQLRLTDWDVEGTARELREQRRHDDEEGQRLQ